MKFGNLFITCLWQWWWVSFKLRVQHHHIAELRQSCNLAIYRTCFSWELLACIYVCKRRTSRPMRCYLLHIVCVPLVMLNSNFLNADCPGMSFQSLTLLQHPLIDLVAAWHSLSLPVLYFPNRESPGAQLIHFVRVLYHLCSFEKPEVYSLETSLEVCVVSACLL